jgi:hypothetical protein
VIALLPTGVPRVTLGYTISLLWWCSRRGDDTRCHCVPRGRRRCIGSSCRRGGFALPRERDCHCVPRSVLSSCAAILMILHGITSAAVDSSPSRHASPAPVTRVGNLLLLLQFIDAWFCNFSQLTKSPMVPTGYRTVWLRAATTRVVLHNCIRPPADTHNQASVRSVYAGLRMGRGTGWLMYNFPS